MITEQDLAAAGLKKNPFSLLPNEGVEIWAGRERLKGKLLDVVQSVRSDHVGLSEFVILHGAYGAGKSHALLYLRWLITAREPEEFRSPVAYLPTVRTADKASFLELYCAIIARVGRDEISRMAAAVVERVQERRDEIYGKATGDELRQPKFDAKIWSVAKAEILGSFAEKFDLLDCLGRNEDNAWFYICCSDIRISPESYTRMGLPGPMYSGYDAALALGMLVNVGCRVPLKSGLPFWKAFYLFVDEMERLIELESKSILSVNSGFRDLLNQCPENLCLIFGFTGEAADVQTIIEQGLFDRLTRSPAFALPALDTDEAAKFLREVLAAYRTDPAKYPDFYPFTEEAIRYIVEETTDKTPRKLFRNCRVVLDKAATAGTLRKGMPIDKGQAESLLVGDEE